MFSNLSIRHSYLNIKINNQRKTLHAWSLTTVSNIDSQQYTENWNLRFYFQKWYFYNPGIIVFSNLSIRHSYLNIKINNQRKTLHAWSLTTESNIDSQQYTENMKLKVFLPKLILLQSRHHCNFSNLSIRHSYLNIKINNQRKTQHAWSLTTESNIDSQQYTENWNLRVSLPKLIIFESRHHCVLKIWVLDTLI